MKKREWKARAKKFERCCMASKARWYDLYETYRRTKARLDELEDTVVADSLRADFATSEDKGG
jgi:hypothetical protein